MELNRLIQHPEEMDRETLYDLRALLALYPYYQTARLLMLKNLYLLHDPSFDEELRRAAIYISDRKVIFQMIEAAHYQLKRTQTKPQGMGILDAKKKEDRTSSLIDHFLDSIPTDNEENEKKKEKRKPTPADAAVDYVSYLMETETEQKMEQPSRTISLINDFIEEGGFNLEKINGTEESETKSETGADIGSDTETDTGTDIGTDTGTDIGTEPAEATPHNESSDNGGIFTETLARIYIKQGKYERAYQIIDRLHKQHPQKSAYYVDQLRFLEKLILNAKK